MQYWKVACIVLLTSVVLLGGMAANAQERRIQATQDAQATTGLEAVAGALGAGEMLIKVSADGIPTILVKDNVCGECNITLDHALDDDIYKVDFFGSIEDLLEDTTGRTIDSLTDMFIVFESGVSEELFHSYRAVFRRYKAYWLDCCSKAQGYSCCPNTLNTYFHWENALPASVDLTDLLHDFTDRIHVVKTRTVNAIEALVISDGSLDDFRFAEEQEEEKPSFLKWLFGLFSRDRSQEPPSLTRWLQSKLPPDRVHSLDLVVLPDEQVQLTSDEDDWSLSATSIVLAIAVYDAPDANAAAIKAAVERSILQAVSERQENPLVVLFVVPNPSTAMIDPGLSIQAASVIEQGTVFVSATSQHADLLKETLNTLLSIDLHGGSVTVDSLTDILRPLGLLAFVF